MSFREGLKYAMARSTKISGAQTANAMISRNGYSFREKGFTGFRETGGFAIREDGFGLSGIKSLLHPRGFAEKQVVKQASQHREDERVAVPSASQRAQIKQKADLAAQVASTPVPGQVRRIEQLDAGAWSQQRAASASEAAKAARQRVPPSTPVEVESKAASAAASAPDPSATSAALAALVQDAPKLASGKQATFLVDIGQGKPLLFNKKEKLHDFYGTRHKYKKLGGITRHPSNKVIQLSNGHFVTAIAPDHAKTLAYATRLTTRNIEKLARSVEKTRRKQRGRAARRSGSSKAVRQLIPKAPLAEGDPGQRQASQNIVYM